jgi:hypothetical protein
MKRCKVSELEGINEMRFVCIFYGNENLGPRVPHGTYPGLNRI